MTTTTDTEKARRILQAILQRKLVQGDLPSIESISAALAKEREATWEAAIQIVKYADVENHWPLREGTLVKALEAARKEGNK